MTFTNASSRKGNVLGVHSLQSYTVERYNKTYTSIFYYEIYACFIAALHGYSIIYASLYEGYVIVKAPTCLEVSAEFIQSPTNTNIKMTKYRRKTFDYRS